MLRLTSRYGPLDETRLVNFEAELGSKLPDSYRRFLLRLNGGRATCAGIDIKDWEGGGTLMDIVYGIPTAEELADSSFVHSSLSLQLNRLDFEQLPSDILPVAHDSSGNEFLLRLAGPKAGEVLFWESCSTEYHPDPDDEFHNVYHVADDFDEFVGLFSEYDPVALANSEPDNPPPPLDPATPRKKKPKAKKTKKTRKKKSE